MPTQISQSLQSFAQRAQFSPVESLGSPRVADRGNYRISLINAAFYELTDDQTTPVTLTRVADNVANAQSALLFCNDVPGILTHQRVASGGPATPCQLIAGTDAEGALVASGTAAPISIPAGGIIPGSDVTGNTVTNGISVDGYMVLGVQLPVLCVTQHDIADGHPPTTVFNVGQQQAVDAQQIILDETAYDAAAHATGSIQYIDGDTGQTVTAQIAGIYSTPAP